MVRECRPGGPQTPAGVREPAPVFYKAGYTLMQRCIRISISLCYLKNMTCDLTYVIAQYYTFRITRKRRSSTLQHVELTASTFSDKWSNTLRSLPWKFNKPAKGRGRGKLDVGNLLVTSRAYCQCRVRNCRKPHEVFGVMCVNSIPRCYLILCDSAPIAILSVRYGMQDVRAIRARTLSTTFP